MGALAHRDRVLADGAHLRSEHHTSIRPDLPGAIPGARRALSVVYTWVYHGAGGSLLLAILLHVSYNMTITVATSAWPDFPLVWLVVLLWIVAAPIGFALSRRSRGHSASAEP